MMMDGGLRQQPPASGPVQHIPVLLHEAIKALALSHSGDFLGDNVLGGDFPGGDYLDGTFGGGGYTRALLDQPATRVLALDRDPQAIAAGSALSALYPGRLFLSQTRFSQLADTARALGFPALDGVVLDIGVSSMQIDQAARGFSFRQDGPLDMRMESGGVSAADLINEEDEDRLADIFYYYGEERASRRIARAIAMDRKKAPFKTTLQLAQLIERIAPVRASAQHRALHPATRVFQALRIAVNDELGELIGALEQAESILKPGGRLAVVTFHSLEDRIVKQFFAARSGRGAAQSRLLPGEPIPLAPTFELSGSQPVAPDARETDANPRARSAKLRWARRTEAPARQSDAKILRLAQLPERRG